MSPLQKVTIEINSKLVVENFSRLIALTYLSMIKRLLPLPHSRGEGKFVFEIETPVRGTIQKDDLFAFLFKRMDLQVGSDVLDYLKELGLTIK